MKQALRTEWLREIRNTLPRFLSILFLVALGVAFFSGIRATEPDMRLSVDWQYDSEDFMDIRVLSTQGMTEDDLNAIKAIDGVEEAEASYTKDVLCDIGDSEAAIKLYAKNDKLNQVKIQEGRNIKESGECLIDTRFANENNIKTGDHIKIKSGNDESIEDSLKKTEYVVVGIADYNYYLTRSKGTTTIGNGKLEGFLVVPKEDFDMDVYTEIYISVKGAKDLVTYTEEYDNLIESVTDRLDEIKEEREEVRYEEIVSEAQDEIRDAEHTYQKKKSKAEKKLLDAKKKLEDAKEELESGQEKLEESKKKLDSGEKQLQSGQKEYETGLKQWKSGQEEYESGLKQWKSGQKEYETGLKQWKSGQKEYETGLKQWKSGQKEYKTGLKQWKSGQKKYETGLKQWNVGEQEYESSLSTYEKNLSQYNTKKKQLVSAKKELDAAAASYGTTCEKLTPEYGELYEQYQTYLVSKKQLDSAKAKLDQTKTQLDTAKKKLDQTKTQLNSTKKKLDQTKTQLNSTKKKLDQTKTQLNSTKKKLDQTKTQLNSAKKKLDQTKAQLNLAKKKLDASEKKLNVAKTKLETSKAELKKGKESYAQGVKELKSGQKEYEEGLKTYQEQKKEAEKEFAKAEKKIQDAKEEVSKLEKGEWYILDRNKIQAYVEYGQDSERIGAIGKVFPMIFFLVAALVSLTTMTRMVEKERTQLGTMKALGYSKVQIAGKYLIYASLATVLGSALGMAAGEKILPKIIITAYGMMYTGVHEAASPIRFDLGLMATAMAFVATIGATMFSCYRELQEVPAQLMRPEAPKEGKRVFLERIPFLWKHISFLWKSSIRNLLRYKKRFFMTIIGIGGCMALLLVGFGLHDSIFAITDNQYTKLHVYDAMISFDEDNENLEKEMQDVLDRPEITSGIRVRQTSMSVENKKGTKTAYVIVPEDNEQINQYVKFTDRTSDQTYTLDDDGIIITEKIANMLEIKVGDTISLKEGDTSVVEVKVSAISENYLQHYVFLSKSLYQTLYGKNPKYNELICNTKSQEESFEKPLSESLLKTDGVNSVSFVSDVEKEMSDMLGNLNIVVFVLVFSAGLLAFVVLYNLNNINIEERRRELATIKVLGFYQTELASYVYRENIMLTVIGTFAGIFLGIGLHRYVILTAEVDYIMFGRNIYLPSFGYSILLTFLFAVIVNAAMYFKLKKIDMVESLKSVE
jgi:putative ABC transport system permease protein